MENQLKGKVYKSQVLKLPCLVDAETFDFQYDEFGPDKDKMFHLHSKEHYLVEVDLDQKW